IPGSPRSDNQAVLDARRARAVRFAPTASQRPPRRAPDGKLRVGYVSSFFHHRNWMKPVWGVINHHNRDPFDVHPFSDAAESATAQGYQRDSRDRFFDMSGRSNADVIRMIGDAGIDVLVDLNGYSKLGRMDLFAHRPAPVQVAWFNYYATSGMDCFDAVYVDATVLPPEEERFCSEPVVRVPACYLAFEVGYPVPDVVPAPGLARGHVTFGCFAPQYKI